MTTRSSPPSRARAWLLASRPATLPAAVGPVLVGLGVAIGLGVFEPLPALAALAVALLLQVLSNLANDLSDFRSGADTDDRLGPPRAAAQGWLSEREMVAGIGVVVGLAGLVGLYLVWVGGLPILLLGVAAVISAFAYTGGPFPYGYHGLGEIFVFVFFGLVAVAGTTYLQTLTWEPLAVMAAVPVGSLITAILVVNNLRDIDADRRAGKLTLAARRGRTFAMQEYDTLLVFAYAMPVGLVLAGDVSIAVLLPLASAPLALALRRVVRAPGDPRRLNPVLRETARLSLLYSALFAAGLALPGLT
ncbi:MAG: 1,4-dihydroxy-2-naphthoate polyprenyltransferase [Candidatus Limnocylindrales bacterium]